ncbi:39716_t:CDS:2 [Gigaspora margarita]|uniref:39716_t:CDS:1 n=1 Tax=Gigaspora margarita TaxID=4874 RepID=A0ABM8W2H1_GIGMA|nr:39716_t:CDS:2 [Gigaspora margarita]
MTDIEVSLQTPEALESVNAPMEIMSENVPAETFDELPKELIDTVLTPDKQQKKKPIDNMNLMNRRGQLINNKTKEGVDCMNDLDERLMNDGGSQLIDTTMNDPDEQPKKPIDIMNDPDEQPKESIDATMNDSDEQLKEQIAIITFGYLTLYSRDDSGVNFQDLIIGNNKDDCSYRKKIVRKAD